MMLSKNTEKSLKEAISKKKVNDGEAPERVGSLHIIQEPLGRRDTYTHGSASIYDCLSQPCTSTKAVHHEPQGLDPCSEGRCQVDHQFSAGKVPCFVSIRGRHCRGSRFGPHTPQAVTALLPGGCRCGSTCGVEEHGWTLSVVDAIVHHFMLHRQFF